MSHVAIFYMYIFIFLHRKPTLDINIHGKDLVCDPNSNSCSSIPIQTRISPKIQTCNFLFTFITTGRQSPVFSLIKTIQLFFLKKSFLFLCKIYLFLNICCFLWSLALTKICIFEFHFSNTRYRERERIRKLEMFIRVNKFSKSICLSIRLSISYIYIYPPLIYLSFHFKFEIPFVQQATKVLFCLLFYIFLLNDAINEI